MTNPESIQVFRDKERDVEKRIIAAVGRVGPRNIAELSRLTKVHQETIRYKFKQRFRRLGFRFHAEVDYRKLGLTPYWMNFSLSPSHYGTAPELFRLLNRSAYLNYFAKVMPKGNYIARIATPAGKSDDYTTLLKWMNTQGILTSFTIREASVSRHVSMNPDFFNFRSRRWEIPWDEVEKTPSRPIPVTRRAGSTPVDYHDLLILKELQKDSTQHLTSIARNVKVNQKTLEYHYRTHIVKEKLVQFYFVRWAQDTSKTLAHSVALTRLVFHNLSDASLRSVQTTISKIPFLWMEDLMDDRTYVASLYVPLGDMLSLFGYVNSELGELGSAVDVEYVKTNQASSFTIPYEMWEDREWKFKVHDMKSAIMKEYPFLGAKKKRFPRLGGETTANLV
jgi:DNA-binding Lrp family transcriptional regulator